MKRTKGWGLLPDELKRFAGPGDEEEDDKNQAADSQAASGE